MTRLNGSPQSRRLSVSEKPWIFPKLLVSATRLEPALGGEDAVRSAAVIVRIHTKLPYLIHQQSSFPCNSETYVKQTEVVSTCTLYLKQATRKCYVDRCLLLVTSKHPHLRLQITFWTHDVIRHGQKRYSFEKWREPSYPLP
jgi:hypothetical protein